jgi:hypothetical protein
MQLVGVAVFAHHEFAHGVFERSQDVARFQIGGVSAYGHGLAPRDRILPGFIRKTRPWEQAQRAISSCAESSKIGTAPSLQEMQSCFSISPLPLNR